MQTIIVRTPAKLNLTFDILGLRPDGFHDIETVFQAVSLEDELTVSFLESGQPELQIVLADAPVSELIPLDENNLVSKAAKIFFEHAPARNRYKIRVHLKKNIPVGAGLAGGSANAAGMLLALNQAYGKPLALAELMQIGSVVGSDVPFCLSGGTCLGRGRGELLTQINSGLDFYVCLVKPGELSVSTPWAYRRFDQYRQKTAGPRLDKVMDGLRQADLELALSGFANVFEPLVFEQYPQLALLKEMILASGARLCQMTGSGPTLFAIVAGEEMGRHIRRRLLSGTDNFPASLSGSDSREALLPLEFHLAKTCSYGARIIS